MNRIAELRPRDHSASVGCLTARRGCSASRPSAHAPSRLPVVLVHGYPGTSASWLPLRSALAAAGFSCVAGLDDTVVGRPVEQLAEEVSRRAFEAMTAAGSDRVHLVGHGAGGVALGHVAAQGAVGPLTATVVTVASPLRRTPGEPGLWRGNAAAAGTRSARRISYFSDSDHVVPTSKARLRQTGPDAVNVLVPGCGHLAICRDQRLIRSMVAQLARSEHSPAPAALADVSYAALAA